MPDYQEYIQAWRERFEVEAALGLERKQKALEAAEGMAELLFDKYGVSAVYVFGSVILPDKPFTGHSDIDVAVADLSNADFFKAWRDLESISGFRVDLFDLEHCVEGFREIILSQGRRYTRNGSTLPETQ
jgi:predicted nucleotidyltransferase